MNITELKSRPGIHWTEGINKDTTPDGYFIEHAGSLWAGQPNTQNTIDELINVAKKHGFRPGFCSISKKSKSSNIRYFHGNMEGLSNAFSVIIWNDRITRKVQRALRLYTD